MAIVVSPVNRKGGVGKSSSVYHLSGYFADHGLRVLCIDNEPQHSLTNGFLGPVAADKLLPSETTAALFDYGAKTVAKNLIRNTEFEHIDLVCGHDALDQFNGPPEQSSDSILLAIKRFVDQVKDQYDFVLIDNPPNLQVCTFASLAASNFTYCISKPQEYDVQGLVPVQKAIDSVMRTTNPMLRFTGYVLNLVNSRRSLHKAYEQLLRETYGSKVLTTTLPDWNDFAESLTARQPVSFFRPHSAASKVLKKLATEMIDRMIELRKCPPQFQSQPLNTKPILNRSKEAV